MITLTDNDADFILQYLRRELEKNIPVKKMWDDNSFLGDMTRKYIAEVEQEAEKEADCIRKCIELLTIGSKEE